MPTNVLMPQMGESIAEGTIVRWIKKVGDAIDKDEPLFEISTDKVDAEIPAPAEGVLAEIRAGAGETVPVDTIVAVIGRPGEDVRSAGSDRAVSGTAPGVPPAVPQGVPAEPARLDAGGDHDDMARRRRRSSPLVRRMATEHGLDISRIDGSGAGGRVTKRDVLAHLESQPRTGATPASPSADAGSPAPTFGPGETVEIVPMSIMRRAIADHMIRSRQVSAHVHSVIEVDFSRVVSLKQARQADYAAAGVKPTYLAFIAKAVVHALQAVPIVNAAIDEERIVYKKDINLGIAVALEDGLIVPVIKNADEKNLLGLSRAIADLAQRARSKQLEPDEVQGGTFTITNPGVFGSLFGTPIINQPQVAILGVGAVEKRPVVVDDAIAIRPRAYLTLGFDHRLIDGAVGDRFLSDVRNQLEGFDLTPG